MPLVFNKLLPSGTYVWVWHLTETTEALQKFISDENFQEIQRTFHHPIRRLQKMVTCILLQGLGEGKSIDIQYDERGKPSPVDYPGHVSISHSRNYVGLMYHPLLPCGLDLEEIRERILHLAGKFVNDHERSWINHDTPLLDTGLIWSVKEALFKNIGGGGIIFKDQLFVNKPHEADEKGGKGYAWYKSPGTGSCFEYQYIYLEDVLLVHTIASEREAVKNL